MTLVDQWWPFIITVDFLSIGKRTFNLLRGVNQGCGLLLARGLEKRQPVALVNAPENIEFSLIAKLVNIVVYW